MTPIEASQRIKNLGDDATQYCFCRLVDANVANFSRYLRGDASQISLEKQTELAKILDDCELLKTVYEPVPVSFRNPVKVQVLLDYLNGPEFGRESAAVLEARMRSVWRLL